MRQKILFPDEIFKEINSEENPLFERVSFKKTESSEVAVQKKVEQVAKIISHLEAYAEVFKKGEKYNIEIHFPPFSRIPENMKVTISPFSCSEEKNLEEKMIFENVPLNSISEFYLLKVVYADESDSEIRIERMIKIPTKNIPYEEREESVINDVISDADSFAEYVTLFLSKTPSATQSEIINLKESNAKWKISNTQSPLYETLLKASAANPSAIKGLESDLRLMKNTIVSDEFRMMYTEFLKAIQDE